MTDPTVPDRPHTAPKGTDSSSAETPCMPARLRASAPGPVPEQQAVANVVPLTSPRQQARAFEGRQELDEAWRVFRKALIGLATEGHRSDTETLAKVGPIAAEAARVLRVLAGQARLAEGESSRNRRLLQREEERLERLRRKAARRGLVVRGMGPGDDAA
ncbi:hypothetical protein [Streptomyces africanus]|uniref:hypothetical protein n=1 Tax=Streptomyces africanus TaxID=231024 RepID=UPI00117E7FE9|nr:hypothetical protein [Streptomyces africanus]